MSLEALLLILLFLALVTLPLVPGFLELWRPRDNRPLDIEQVSTEHPRELGRTFRDALAPILAETGPDLPHRAAVGPGRHDGVEVHQELRLPPATSAAALLVALGGAEVGDGAQLGDVYVRGDARLGAAVRLQRLACDGDLTLGPGGVVEHWIDAEGTAWIGPRASLGFSASAGKELHLGPGVTFQRVWGLPISIEGPGPAAARPAPPDPTAGQTIEESVVWAGRRLSLPGGLVLERDVVVQGELRVGAGMIIRGSVKAHGPIHLAERVQIQGHLIGRRGIRIDGGGRIGGNVFAEGDVSIGPGTQIGQPDGFKSVYATGRVTLSPEVLVFGWVVAECGGAVA